MREDPGRISRRDLLRGERPAVLVEADATDPAATGTALGALQRLVGDACCANDLNGPLARARAAARRRSSCACTARYNPEAITQYNIVPGLMGVILTMTMVMMTGARDHARARARHDGEPARHAGRGRSR